MYMRVTAQTLASNVIANMEQQSSALATITNQVSSGIRIQSPSDDPAGWVALTQAQTASNQLGAYSQTISDATSTLNAGTSALQNVSNILSQATQIATQGANVNTATSPDGYSALATQVNGLITQLVSAANSTSGGTYLFGGTATTAPPFQVTATDAQGDPNSVSYVGSTAPGRELIGAGQTVDTRYVGSQVFQASGADAFQALITLRNNLTNPTLTQSEASMSTALNQSLSDISAASTSVDNATAEQASSVSTLTATQSRVQALQLAANTEVGNVGGTDYTSAIVQMQSDQTALQASEDVSAKLLQTNLLSFIQ
jgi:flagellar hook-associated protein 3 FlgL